MNEQLLGYLFDEKADTHLLASSMSRWIDLSPRFRAFATTYRDKIRKKIRTTQSDASIKDLEAELAAAFWLLQEKRFTVAYEPYSSEKSRAPDFAVTFKSFTFNVEVTRIGLREGERPTPTTANEPALTLEPEQVGGRLTDSVCDKLGQMRPGMINLLLVMMDSDFFRVLDIQQAMAQLRVRAERKEAGLFARYGFVNSSDFFKYYLRLSGVLVRNAGEPGEEDGTADSLLWLNKQTKHPLPRPLQTLLQRG